MGAERKGEILRASELAEYAYCARAWWLHRVRGLASANVAALQAGQTSHRRHGSRLERASRLRRWAIALLLLAVAVLVTGVLLLLGH